MQFYHVLIVDDEPYIVNCLTDLLVSQQDMNIDICQAYNSEEALHYMERQRIDILLSDIEMPGMSGLALIRTVKKRWPTCKTLLVTAHPVFEYAYEASHLGIVSYILKTETDEFIVAEVKRAIHLIEEELNQSGLIVENTEDMRNALNLAKRELFFSILDNRNAYTLIELSQMIRTLGFHDPIGGLFLLSGHIVNTPESGDPNHPGTLAKAFYTVKMIMSHYITSILKACRCETKQDRIYWLLQPGQEMDVDRIREPFVPWLVGMLETVQQSCLSTAGIRISFIVSPPITSLTLLAEIYHKNDILLHSLGMRQANFIYTYKPMEESPITESDSDFDCDACCSRLQLLWEAERYDEFLTLLDTACNHIHAGENFHDLNAFERYYSIVLLLLSLIDRRGLRQQIMKRINLDSLFYPHIYNSWEIATEYLKKLASFLIESTTEAQEDISQQTIRRTKEYIDEHIAKDISLQQLSEVTGYNLSYLSRFFSEKAGEKLNQYIAKRKLEYIRTLMRDSSFSLNDIAEQAGFKTRSYFNRFIKRVVGTTPQKLREEVTGKYEHWE